MRALRASSLCVNPSCEKCVRALRAPSVYVRPPCAACRAPKSVCEHTAHGDSDLSDNTNCRRMLRAPIVNCKQVFSCARRDPHLDYVLAVARWVALPPSRRVSKIIRNNIYSSTCNLCKCTPRPGGTVIKTRSTRPTTRRWLCEKSLQMSSLISTSFH